MFKRDIRYITQSYLLNMSDYYIGMYDNQELFGIDDDIYDLSLNLEIYPLIK